MKRNSPGIIYKKVCKRCDETYQPTGKKQKFCVPCYKFPKLNGIKRR